MKEPNAVNLLALLTMAQQTLLQCEIVLENKDRLKKNNFVYRVVSLQRNLEQVLKEAAQLSGIDLDINNELSVGVANMIEMFSNQSSPNFHIFLELSKRLFDKECTEDDIFVITNPVHKEYVKKLLGQKF